MRTARLTIVLQSARHSPCGSRIRGFRLSLATALRFFTNHETRITAFMLFTNRGIFSPWARQGGATGNRRPDHCVRRQVTVCLFTIVHDCSPLFGKKYCWEPVSPRRPDGRSRRPVDASLGVFARHGAAIARHARGGVGGEPVSGHCQPFSVGLAASVAAGQFPMPRTQNEPMLRKGNVPACMSHHVARRSA